MAAPRELEERHPTFPWSPVACSWLSQLKNGIKKRMASRLGRLEAADISRFGAGRYHDGDELYLSGGMGSPRSWIFRCRRDGKLHE
jgi:hypothetical protein